MTAGAEDPGGLVDRVQALSEPRMRVAVLAEALGEGPAAPVVQLIGALIARGGDGPAAYRAALDAVVQVLSEEGRLVYERRAALYAAAVEAGDEEVAMLFLDAAPAAPGTEDLERHLGEDRALVPRGRALTLGERKSLARAHRRDVLLQIARDPHPDVIVILLDNPHLTEADVLRLASRRPMLPSALAAIAAHERWRARAQVRRALVLNPYTAIPLAARLMTTLADADLHQAAADPSLPERLRRHARGIRARRRGSRLTGA